MTTLYERRIRLRVELDGTFLASTGENVIKSFDKWRQDLHKVGGMERIEVSIEFGPFVPMKSFYEASTDGKPLELRD